MKLVFVSNLLTPHQEPICDEFFKILKEDFAFIETIKRNDQLPIGWKPSNIQHSYLITYNGNIDSRLIDEADVVLFGSATDDLLINRLKNNKLTFRYSERFYKESWSIRNIFRRITGSYLHHGRFKKYPLFMLCASSYTAKDCKLFLNYENRKYKWGYFPKMINYSEDYFEKKYQNSEISLLWVGRFVCWKHPEQSLEVAKRLKEKGINFKLTMIGDGDLFEDIKKRIFELNLSENVYLTGALSPDEVRKYMEKSKIFLFTSDRNEGWGAVLNEAMNSGCCCFSSDAIGASGYLLKDGMNGFVFGDGDLDDLTNKLIAAIRNSESMKNISIEAYKTIVNYWNAQISAERFIELSNLILSNMSYYRKNLAMLYQDGPCSPER